MRRMKKRLQVYVVIVLTSIGKHMGWVTFGPNHQIIVKIVQMEISAPEQQLRSSSMTSSISEVRVMS